MAKTISQNELDVIQLLLEQGNCSIAQLEKSLNVTATAVRQRLNRLMDTGLVDRQSESDGRGRPKFKYGLTESGRKAGGNNLSDFASALWNEIQKISDDDLRKSIISGVAKNLAQRYSAQLDGETLGERVKSVARLFVDRDIPISVEKNNHGLPILKILSCPYPDLANGNHEICEMERQLFSEVTGETYELCQCRLDGDTCCSFQPESAAQN